MELKPIEQQASRFTDPDQPDKPMSIVLRHVDDASKEEWYLERRIAYDDRHLGTIVVPRDKDTFTTDLTSVPDLFTWLVPRTGNHLAAALVHDALTPPFSDPKNGPDWTPIELKVSQLDADRVFRDAMADLGTPLIRRWMVWSAVSIPTAWKAVRWKAVPGYLGLFAIVVLGWFATLDLFDQGNWLPWMWDRHWFNELLLGGAMAVVIPLALAALWPSRLRRAGAITGVALAALLPVTALVGSATFAYQVAEYRLKVWAAPKWWQVLLKVGATLAAIGLAWLTFFMFRRYG